MEPSLGSWAHSPEEARAKVEAGFRNFVFSMEDFILHFSIRQYLCRPGQRYYMTDMAKGAMLVDRAAIDRIKRYDRWYPLLLEELDLVAAPRAQFFAVGGDVARYLSRRFFRRSLTKVIHYSGQAASARAAGIVGQEASFAQFRESVSLDRVLATAEEVLRESVPATFQEETLARLARRQLSESQRQLIFNYKLGFEETIRTRN
jgi:hypothetical protein